MRDVTLSHLVKVPPPLRNNTPLGPYSRTMHMALWWPLEGGLVLMSEVPL